MFEWIYRFIDLIVSVFPRWVKIRATHRGVKWPRCQAPVEMLPGLRWVWPLVTEWEVVVTARQTDDLPPQTLTLTDGTTVAVAGLAIYSIDDVVKAYGERNWDVTSTVRDLSMGAIAEVITSIKKEQLKDLKPINKRITELVREWASEYGVAVERLSLVEVSQARTIRHLGLQMVVSPH